MRNRSGASAVQSLTVGASAQVLPLIAGYGLNLLATPYVVSQLGLHDFGVWAMTGAIAQYAALFDLGASRAVNRYVALFHARGEADSDRAVVGICVSAIFGVGAVFGTFVGFWPAVPETILRTGDPALHALSLALLGRNSDVWSCGARAGRRIVRAGPAGTGQRRSRDSWHQPGQRRRGGIDHGAEPAQLRVGHRDRGGDRPVRRARRHRHRRRQDHDWTSTCGHGAGDHRLRLKSQALGAADVVLFQSGKLIAGIVIGPAAAGAYELGIRLVQGVQAFGSAASVAITTHLTRAYATGGLTAVRVTLFTAHSSQRGRRDLPACFARSHRVLRGSVVAR